MEKHTSEKEQNKWIKMLVGLGAVGAITALGFMGQSCDPDKVNLKVSDSEQLCLTQEDYQTIRGNLLTEFMADKDYDFHIDSRALLGAVLNYETEQNGGITLENVETKEDVRDGLIDLLK